MPLATDRDPSGVKQKNPSLITGPPIGNLFLAGEAEGPATFGHSCEVWAGYPANLTSLHGSATSFPSLSYVRVFSAP